MLACVTVGLYVNKDMWLIVCPDNYTVRLTLLDHHSSSSTVGHLFCDPDPRPVPPEHMGRTSAPPCAVPAAPAVDNL